MINILSSLPISFLDLALALSALSFTSLPTLTRHWPRLRQCLQDTADQTWNYLYITVLSNYWHFSVWQFWGWEVKIVRSLACLLFPSWPFKRGSSITPWQHLSLSNPSGLIWNNFFFSFFFFKVKCVTVMDSSSNWVARSQSCEVWHLIQPCACMCACV